MTLITLYFKIPVFFFKQLFNTKLKVVQHFTVEQLIISQYRQAFLLYTHKYVCGLALAVVVIGVSFPLPASVIGLLLWCLTNTEKQFRINHINSKETV